MGKSEIRFFPHFSKTVGNFGILSSFFIEALGAYRMAEKNWWYYFKLSR